MKILIMNFYKNCGNSEFVMVSSYIGFGGCWGCLLVMFLNCVLNID